MKKKFFSVLVFAALTLTSVAQVERKVTVKAGTIVPLEAVKEVRGAHASEGQSVDFRVTRDVMANGTVAIPAGTIAKGTVYEAKRSSVFGTRGRLGVKIRSLSTPSGDVVNFSSTDVYIKGANRTAASVVVFLFTMLPIPCGGKAVMPVGFEVDATVASNTTITVSE